MTKRFLTLSVVAAMMLSTLTGCGGGASTSTSTDTTSTEAKPSSGESITLRLANNHADGYPTSAACDYFAELVKEKSDGRITIETYHGAVLGEEKSTIEQVQIGGIDFARVSISPLAEFEDSLNALQLPYLYRDQDHMWSVLNGEIGENFLNSENMAAKGIVGLNWYDSGSRNFYNTKKEIHTPEDLAGLKIRVQESSLMMGLVSAMGADPTPMAFADVYSALQTGVIDGAENNWPSYISTSHYEVAKFITVDEHTRVPEMIIASKKTLEKLSPEDQQLIKDCAKESTAKQLELWKAYSDESEQTAKDAGCTVTYLEADQVTKFQEAVAELNKTEGAKYTDVINAIAEVQ